MHRTTFALLLLAACEAAAPRTVCPTGDCEPVSADGPNDTSTAWWRPRGGDPRWVFGGGIIGDLPNGCSGADPAVRYHEAVFSLAGAAVPVCDSGWDDRLYVLGSALAGALVSPGTCSCSIDANGCRVLSGCGLCPPTQVCEEMGSTAACVP